MRNSNVKHLTYIAMGVALNIVGALVAYSLRLPIYLDSIGTILIACLLGPKYAVITGLAGSLVSGMTFDVYSIYFAPVQILTGFFSGIMYQKNFLKGMKTFLGVLIFTIPTSIASAVIAAFLFGGVTSSGSSYIVQMLGAIGVPTVVGVFATQIVTDYADKFLAVILVGLVVAALPKQIKRDCNIDTKTDVRQHG